MLIIPVIDLSNGVVIHALHGKRELYRPIKSKISDSCNPDSILSAFFQLYPFKIIYIADIDAIQGKNSHSKLINKFADNYKECEFWVDAGLEYVLENKSYCTGNNIKPILGSENDISFTEYQKIINSNPDTILSLDFNDNGLINNSYLLDKETNWPKKVIIMRLHLVGSNSGVDKNFLKDILKINKNSEIYVAGGIRNTNDIKILNLKNINGCLISTALHQQNITKEELDALFLT